MTMFQVREARESGPTDSFTLLNGEMPRQREENPDIQPGAMTTAQLETMIEDGVLTRRWRARSDKCAEYYDNNQTDPETAARLREKGMEGLQRNVIQPMVNAVLGLEERSRTDWKCVTDYDDQQDVADALSAKLKEAERESRADYACSEAFAGSVKTGFAAVEVSRASNPFHFPYRVEYIHRREIQVDPRSRKLDWSDARYVIRKRWFDIDVAAAYFPASAMLIQSIGHGDFSRWAEAFADVLPNGSVAGLLNGERFQRLDDMEWRDTARKRVCIYEVWYRTFHRGMILRLPRGRVVEFNPANPQHQAVIAAGLVQPQEAVYDKIRCAYYCGPHRLADYASERRHFPYVGFYAYREDLTGDPYGIIYPMISVQDEINARLRKFMWLLTSRRTVVDEDAVDSEEARKWNDLGDLSKEIARADAFIVLNKSRRNENALRVDENLELADAQHKAMQDAINSLPQVTGIYSALLGQQSGTTAASAIHQLIDQGTTGLAEVTSNFAYSKRLVGERLLEMVKEDLVKERNHAVMHDDGTLVRKVVVNIPYQDENGVEMLKNSVSAANIKVQLADIPETPSYRAQQFTQMSELVKSLPPELQVLLLPFVIDLSDQPKRREVSKVLREKLGILDERSPEAAQAKEEQKAMANAQAQQLARKFDADLAEQDARTKKMLAEADETRARVQTMGGDQSAQMEAQRQIQALELKFRDEASKHQAEMVMARLQEAAKIKEIQANTELAEAKEAAETERERIRQDAAKEVAKIQAKTAETETAFAKKMKALGEEVDQGLSDVVKRLDDLAKAQAQAAKDHKADRESDRKEQAARGEAKPDPALTALAQSVSEVAQAVQASTEQTAKKLDEVKAAAEAPRTSEVEIKKVGDGAFKAVKTETVKKEK